MRRSTIALMIKQSYKFRIYPNKDQEIQLRKTIGCCRYIYNWGLELRSESYKRNKTRIGFSETSRAMTILKKDSETKWLNDVSAVALQQSLRNLNWSFENFFQKRSDHPKFKKRKTGGSVRFVGEGFSVRGDEFKANRVKKPIKVIWSRELPSKPSSCTISQNPSGQGFVSFVC